MRKKLFASIYFCINLIFLSSGCSRNSNTYEPVNPLLITGKMIEYGSGSAIANADFSYSFCTKVADFGCAAHEFVDARTNEHGFLTIPRAAIQSLHSFDSYDFSKDGYWNNYKGEFSFILPYGSDYPPVRINTSNNADSFLLELFPIVNMRIHLKKISSNSTDTLLLQCQALTSPGYAQRDGNPISLMGSLIDTVLAFPVFGNIENLVYVVKNYTPADTVFKRSQFVNKGDIINLEILY